MGDRCRGLCCKAFVLSHSWEDIGALAERGDEQAILVRRIFRPLGRHKYNPAGLQHRDPQKEASLVEEEVENEYYTCTQQLPNGDCGIYDSRPRLCRNYAVDHRCEYRECEMDAPATTRELSLYKNKEDNVNQKTGKFEECARQIGALVDEKNKAYGDSAMKAADYLSILYPDGVRPEQYRNMLLLVRDFDKSMRIAHDEHAFGEEPWRDKAGYAVLAVEYAQRHPQAIGQQWYTEESPPLVVAVPEPRAAELTEVSVGDTWWLSNKALDERLRPLLGVGASTAEELATHLDIPVSRVLARLQVARVEGNVIEIEGKFCWKETPAAEPSEASDSAPPPPARKVSDDDVLALFTDKRAWTMPGVANHLNIARSLTGRILHKLVHLGELSTFDDTLQVPKGVPTRWYHRAHVKGKLQFQQ